MSRAALDRRSFLTGRFAEPEYVGRPPWTREGLLAEACTGCGTCADACPQEIISIVADRPVVTFSDECTLCGQCADVCPEPVFDKSLAAFPHVASIGEACFASRGIVCQSCGDACPETAIRFTLRLGGPALPALDAERCNGCGACIAQCPASAITSVAIAEAPHA